MIHKSIREKFLKYYSDEDLKKWFDPLSLDCTPESLSIDTPKVWSGTNNISNDLVAGLKNIQVKFPHQLFADWFSLKFKDKFEKTLILCFGANPRITYSCPGMKNSPPVNFKPSIKVAYAPEDLFDEAPISEYPNGSIRNDTFSNFLFNKKNQFPVAASQKFARGKGHLLFILTGASGHGKSHLLHAIYNDLLGHVHKKNIFFDNLDYLVTIFSNASKKNESPLLYFREFKYIIIDDVDSAASNPELQEQITKILEYAYERQIHCAVSLRQKPNDLSYLNEKLRSILESGLIIELKKPDLDIRRQYVDNICKSLNLHIKKDDALALARMYSGFRQIHGALLKVSEFKVLSPQAMEAKLADILQTNFVQSEAILTPDHIINKVSEHLEVSAAEVIGKARRQKAVLARHVSMYLCRELLGAQFGHIGACFSDRDHSSVLYSVNKIKRMLKSDKDTNNLVTELKNLCLK